MAETLNCKDQLLNRSRHYSSCNDLEGLSGYTTDMNDFKSLRQIVLVNQSHAFFLLLTVMSQQLDTANIQQIRELLMISSLSNSHQSIQIFTSVIKPLQNLLACARWREERKSQNLQIKCLYQGLSSWLSPFLVMDVVTI